MIIVLLLLIPIAKVSGERWRASDDIYLYMYIYVYVYLYLYLCIYIYIYIFIYIYISIQPQVLHTKKGAHRPTHRHLTHKQSTTRNDMLGAWVNPHREQQTIPQGQTSLPPKSFSTPTANGQSAPRTGSARGVGRRGEPHTEHGLTRVLLSLYL